MRTAKFKLHMCAGVWPDGEGTPHRCREDMQTESTYFLNSGHAKQILTKLFFSVLRHPAPQTEGHQMSNIKTAKIYFLITDIFTTKL